MKPYGSSLRSKERMVQRTKGMRVCLCCEELAEQLNEPYISMAHEKAKGFPGWSTGVNQGSQTGFQTQANPLLLI